MDQKTHYEQQKLAKTFVSIKSLYDLCRILKTDTRRIMLMIAHPRYKAFVIPKKDGGERLIENPSPELKKTQSLLNRYLQAVYYFEKSSASYGFIVGVRNDDDRRNVLTNARKHIGRSYMVNLDLQDFFHQISLERVKNIFVGSPFFFNPELAELLTKLTTYSGRLPMGSPTSPVLSNFACREMDEALMKTAEKLEWAYTRYADDLTFSAHKSMESEQVKALREQIQAFGFVINERKVRTYGPEDQKIVTGLLVTHKVELAPDFLPLLEKEIIQLKQVIEAQNTQGDLGSRWVEQLKLQIRGRLNFAGFVMGRRNKRFQQLKDLFYEAINPPEEDFGSASWHNFPYFH